MRAHAAIGTAFRAPSLEERFGISSFVVGNAALKPERSLGYEAGLTWQPIRQVELSGTYFGSELRNLIALDFSSFPGTSRNIARARIDGAEFAVAVTPVETLRLRLGWTITEAFDETTNRRLLRRPSNTITGGLNWRPIPDLTLAGEVRYTGAQKDFVYSAENRFGTRGVNPSGTVANATATYRVRPGVEVFGEGRNLGNSRWEPVNSYVLPGRSVLVGTRLSL